MERRITNGYFVMLQEGLTDMGVINCENGEITLDTGVDSESFFEGVYATIRNGHITWYYWIQFVKNKVLYRRCIEIPSDVFPKLVKEGGKVRFSIMLLSSISTQVVQKVMQYIRVRCNPLSVRLDLICELSLREVSQSLKVAELTYSFRIAETFPAVPTCYNPLIMVGAWRGLTATKMGIETGVECVYPNGILTQKVEVIEVF